jgi:hypothetical protein
MAGSRTLKLSILGDVDNLNKSLKTAGNDVDGFGDKIGKAGKAMGAAFAAAAAAAGAYALKIGVDGVKAAIEDEKAQTQLALALQNATGATQGQIKATEDAILQMSLATGVADDNLRPALQRLALSTGDVSKAQDLLSLALDISASTGKPLETVANSLGKAFDGNTAALGKLGIGLSSAELKTMSFEQVQGRLSELFGGAAAANAETYSGRIARMQVAFNEAKETIGYALLPVLEKLMRFVNDFATPVLQAFNDGLSGKGGLAYYITYLSTTIKNVFTPVWEGLQKGFVYIKEAVGDNIETFKQFGAFIANYVAPVLGNVLGKAFEGVGIMASATINVIGSVIRVIGNLIDNAIDGINALIKAYNTIPLLPNIPTIKKPDLTFGSSSTAGGGTTSGGGSTAGGGTTSGGTTSGGGSTAGGGTTSGGSSKGVASAVASGVAAGIASANAKSTFGAGSFRLGEAESMINYELEVQKQQADAEFQAAVQAMEKQKVEDIIATVTAQVAANKANVTVNMGVVGDPEAAARAIVDVLNRSSGRGALGAGALIL